jgi:hypothetical protein
VVFASAPALDASVSATEPLTRVQDDAHQRRETAPTRRFRLGEAVVSRHSGEAIERRPRLA